MNNQEPKIILGIDEVGRGPYAGPLVVGAVMLEAEPIEKTDPELSFFWDNLTDSKKLTAKKRTRLAFLIEKYALASATGWVSAEELDKYGLSASLKLATRRAVKQILAKKIKFSEIIIDGTVNFLQNTPLENHVTLLPKADDLIKAVSAASIVAKVARDNYMVKIAKKYPEYGFEKHVGYGTKSHQAALEQYGVCPEHRQSFRPIREIMKQQLSQKYPTPEHHIISTQKQIPATHLEHGKRAENATAEYLIKHGHKIIHRNYKTKTYEIDLISTKANNIYFTEVKYSKTNSIEGTPLVRITPQKKSQMHYATQSFLNTHLAYQGLNPLLAAASVTGEEYTVEFFELAE